MTKSPLARRIGVLVAATLLVPATIGAQPSDEVQGVLDSLSALFEKAPLRLVFDATLNVPAGDMTMTSSLSGTQLYADPRHMSMDMDMSMSTPQGEMKASMRTVYDGESMWTEMNMPMMGMKNVSRASIDVLEKANAAGSPSAGTLDPREMLGRVAEEVDLTVVDRADGRITLEGVLDAESSEALDLGSAGAALSLDGATVRMIFDTGNGQPRGMQLITNGTTMLDLRYRDVEFIGADGLPADAFSYTPPEGTKVTDLDPVLRQQSQP